MFYKRTNVNCGIVEKPTIKLKNDQLRLKRLFKAKENAHSSWDGRYPIDLKNDKGKGKTTKSIAKNKKVRRRIQSEAKATIKHLQNPPQLEHGGNKKRKKHHRGQIHLL
jgi:hypothetical protein